MNRLISTLLALGLLAAPTIRAEMVTWEIRGVITEIEAGPDDLFLQINVGDAYRVRWIFDTAAPLQREPQPGTFRYNGSATSLVIDIGPVSGIEAAPSLLSRTTLRNDSLLDGNVVDGITLGHSAFDPNDGGFYSFISHVMRGQVLDIFNGPDLPTVPDPRLADLETGLLNICISTTNPPADCALGFVAGSIDSIRLVNCDGNLDATFCDGYELLE